MGALRKKPLILNVPWKHLMGTLLGKKHCDINERLNSERFRVAPRTGRSLRARLRVRETGCTGWKKRHVRHETTRLRRPARRRGGSGAALGARAATYDVGDRISHNQRGGSAHCTEERSQIRTLLRIGRRKSTDCWRAKRAAPSVSGFMSASSCAINCKNLPAGFGASSAAARRTNASRLSLKRRGCEKLLVRSLTFC